MSSPESPEELKAKLNLETSRIHWHELQTYYAPVSYTHLTLPTIYSV